MNDHGMTPDQNELKQFGKLVISAPRKFREDHDATPDLEKRIND